MKLIKKIKNRLFRLFIKMFCKRKHINSLFGTYYFNLTMFDYKLMKPGDFWKTVKAHHEGYLYMVRKLILTTGDYKEEQFVKELDYLKMYPFNGKFNSWVDDKLTTYYMLHKYHEYMPTYYFYINGIGKIRKMEESKYCDADQILQLLKQEKKLVFKQAVGTISQGFLIVSYEDGNYLVNKEVLTEEKMREEILSKRDYIIQEYIATNSNLPQNIHTIRTVVMRQDDGRVQIGNVTINIKNPLAENLYLDETYLDVDPDTGFYEKPFVGKLDKKLNYFYEQQDLEEFRGTIPHWSFVRDKVIEICDSLHEMSYWGLDVFVTEDSFKILEINSNPGVNLLQIIKPAMLPNTPGETFFQNRLIRLQKKKTSKYDAIHQDKIL